MPGTTSKTIDAILFGGEVRTERQLIAEGYESIRMIADGWAYPSLCDIVLRRRFWLHEPVDGERGAMNRTTNHCSCNPTLQLQHNSEGGA
jgi:hypothetical protein